MHKDKSLLTQEKKQESSFRDGGSPAAHSLSTNRSRGVISGWLAKIP
jgi:hypothetical protein